MKIKLVYFLFVLLTAFPARAAELPTLIAVLDADDYNARYRARMDMQAMLADASEPDADPAHRVALEEGLVNGLQSGTNRISRLWLIRMLEWFGTENSVGALENLLAEEDGHLQDAARRALAVLPGDAAGKALQAALEKAPTEQKPAYIDALVYRGDKEAAGSIADLLNVEDPALVAKAAEALGKMQDPAYTGAMNEAREAADETLKPVIEAALLQTGINAELAADLVRNGSRTSIRAGAIRQLAVQDEQAALALLNEVFSQEAYPGRPEILRTAMAMPNQSMREFLVTRLAYTDAAAKRLVLGAVADFVLTDYESNILVLLPETTGDVRNVAVRALGIIGGTASFQPLFEIYEKDPNATVTHALSRLKVPEVDARMFKILKEDANTEKRLAAMKLLALRNTEGLVDQLHTLAAPGQDESLRKEAFKALESAGRVETCKLLAAAIVRQDPLKRPAQQSLKKLSMNLGAPNELWDAVYQPALQSAPDDAAREDLLAILDGAAGSKSLAYLETLVMDSAHPLHAAGTRSLARWPAMEAAEVWIKLMGREGASEEDLAAAQKGLIRIITQVPGDDRKKYDLAVKAIQKAPTPDIKEAIVSRCKRPNNHKKNHFDNAFKVLLDDPDIGLQVHKLLGKTPPASPPAPPPPPEE